MLRSKLVPADWGDPIEAQEFYDRRRVRRRIDAAFSNGRIVSLSFLKGGRWALRMTWARP